MRGSNPWPKRSRFATAPLRRRSAAPWWSRCLSFFTIFIYFFFWWYFVNREMKDLGEAHGTDELGDSPGKSLLAVTLGRR